MAKTASPKQTPVAFFLEHAGYCYDPKTKTVEQGRQRCAEELAAAELAGMEAGLSFEWSLDNCYSSEFSDDPEPWQLWTCLCRDADGESVASLSGIDFGDEDEPWGDSYRRVVQAELAQEALAE